MNFDAIVGDVSWCQPVNCLVPEQATLEFNPLWYSQPMESVSQSRYDVVKSSVRDKCIYKMFKAENRETQFPLLRAKPSIDKHKF